MKTIFTFIFIILIFLFLNLGNFLDATKGPVKSDFIVCLGGGGIERLNTSMDLFKHKFSTKNRLLFMGSKRQFYWKTRKFDKIVNETKDIKIDYAGSFKNTMEELLYVDNFASLKKYKSVLIVTDPFHSRRVKFYIQNFTKNLKSDIVYTIVSSKVRWWNSNLYFLNTKSFFVSMSEVSKIIYNYLKYSFFKNTIISKKLDNIANNIKSYTYKKYGFY